MSIDAKRRLAAAAFVALLLLSVFWPEPVVDVNRLCCHALLGVDDLSFLGREAPSWDVAFWCLAGLFALALMHPTGERRDYSVVSLRLSLSPLPVVVSVIAMSVVLIVVCVWKGESPRWRWGDDDGKKA